MADAGDLKSLAARRAGSNPASGTMGGFMRRSLSLMALLFLLALPALAAQPPDDLEAVVARMARIGGSRSPSFSPDGRRIAFISDRSGVPQVWMVPSEGGEPRQVTRL